MAIRVAVAYLQTRNRRFRDRDQLLRFQERQVRKHLRLVTARSGYYRALFSGLKCEDWRNFPVSDKRSMMANFNDFNTLKIDRAEALEVAKRAEATRNFRPTLHGATVGISSGTTGSYSLFLSTRRENAMFIGTALGKLLRSSLLASHRIAFFHRAHSNLYEGLNTGRMKLQFFDLSEDLESHYRTLNQLQPTQIIGPPFALRHLGRAARAGKLCVSPNALLSVAEVLEEVEREHIEADFGVKLDQAYIATEGFIASTCQQGSLHVNEDCIVMQRERLDAAGERFVPIITDFRRRAQPIIRYRLEDVLIDEPEPCRCGSPFAVIKSVEGRCDDVLILPSLSGESTRRVFPDFIRRAVGFATDSIQEYRVEQTSLMHLSVAIQAADATRAEAEQAIEVALQSLFARLQVAAPQIAFVPELPSGSEGKVRRVLRSFPAEFASREAE